LGTGESGKSTVMKQMQILYGNGFSDTEKESFTSILRRNAFDTMQTLVRYMHETKQPWQSKECEQNVDTFLSLDSYEQLFWTDQSLALILAFWRDKNVKEHCLFSNEYANLQIIDSASYLFDNVERIWDRDFIPNVEDILRARRRTSGIVERVIRLEDNMPFRFVDVGGQRNERRKWLKCFDDVTAVIYVSAISEYDQMMFEDDSKNRMHDSLEVFSTVINHKDKQHVPTFGERTSVIVFLNKLDIFQKKIVRSSLKKHFSRYEGSDFNEREAIDFFIHEFERAARRTIFTHLTCATDTKAFETVFHLCKKMIVKYVSQDMGLY